MGRMDAWISRVQTMLFRGCVGAGHAQGDALGEEEREDELSNSRSLSHCSLLTEHPNCVVKYAKKLASVENMSDLSQRVKVQT